MSLATMAWCSATRSPLAQVGFSPPADHWPGSHQRLTSNGRVGSDTSTIMKMWSLYPSSKAET